MTLIGQLWCQTTPNVLPWRRPIVMYCEGLSFPALYFTGLLLLIIVSWRIITYLHMKSLCVPLSYLTAFILFHAHCCIMTYHHSLAYVRLSFPVLYLTAFMLLWLASCNAPPIVVPCVLCTSHASSRCIWRAGPQSSLGCDIAFHRWGEKSKHKKSVLRTWISKWNMTAGSTYSSGVSCKKTLRTKKIEHAQLWSTFRRYKHIYRGHAGHTRKYRIGKLRGRAIGEGQRGQKLLKGFKRGENRKFGVSSCIKVIEISFSVIFSKDIHGLEFLSRF